MSGNIRFLPINTVEKVKAELVNDTKLDVSLNVEKNSAIKGIIDLGDKILMFGGFVSTFEKQHAKINSSLKNMKDITLGQEESNDSSIKNTFGKFSKFINLAQKVFNVGKDLWNEMIIPAAKTEKAEKLIRYKSGNKENEIVESIYKSAFHSTFGLEDFMRAGESLAPKISGSANAGNNMEKVLAMSERLAMASSRDVSSVASAFKSALSGDFSALISSGISEESINSAGLADLANAGNVDGVVQGLDKVLTELGYTDRFLTDMEDTTLGKVQIIQNSLRSLKSTFGTDLLAPVKPILDDVIQLLEGPVFQLFLKTLKESLAYIIPIVSVVMKILIIVGKFIMSVATIILHLVNFFADLIAKFGKWLGINKKTKKMNDLASTTGLNATNNADKHIKVVEEVGKINNDVNIADEDIKLMRDVAERGAIKNFVTLTPTVSFGSTTINENADANKLLGVITSALEKEVANSARGVYAV